MPWEARTTSPRTERPIQPSRLTLPGRKRPPSPNDLHQEPLYLLLGTVNDYLKANPVGPVWRGLVARNADAELFWRHRFLVATLALGITGAMSGGGAGE